MRVLTWPVRAFLSLLRRFWLLLLLLAGIAAFAFYVVLPRVQQEEAVTVPPQPVEAARQDLLVTVPATGTLDFGTLVQVGFENAGVLTDLKVSAGDSVTAGDVLALQEADDLTREIDDAVSALRRAELDLAEFLEDLEPDPDVYALRRAELDLAEARAALEDSQIPARRGRDCFGRILGGVGPRPGRVGPVTGDLGPSAGRVGTCAGDRCSGAGDLRI